MTKSPTVRLLIGLLVTLVAVAGFSSYALYQLHGLRRLQTDTVDTNRHDSLLLLRIQNDVSTMGLRLRDMMQAPASRSIARYHAGFTAIADDLTRALALETELHPSTRSAAEQAKLLASVRRFSVSADRVFDMASRGEEQQARAEATAELFPRRTDLAANVSHLLEANNISEGNADAKIARIYDGAQQDVYAFLTATILAILGTSLYLIYSNRKMFEQIESLSSQRRVLAAKLITVQEEVLRSVSRELHDEFGQILTAVGAMLARAERKGVPADSPLRTELAEVREITHNTLEKIRSLSQMLHPAVIDDYGLVKALEWYTEIFHRQSGLQTTVTIHGDPVRLTGQSAIHCFRIVQEALTNAAKHSGSKRAEVELIFSENTLRINIQDFGRGFPQGKKPDKRGLGLIAMRERAELMNGSLEVTSVPNAGTTVSLLIPLRRDDQALERELASSGKEEIVSAKFYE
jgi:signal transduction histidine kinase